jgi:hypothetical protein
MYNLPSYDDMPRTLDDYLERSKIARIWLERRNHHVCEGSLYAVIYAMVGAVEQNLDDLLDCVDRAHGPSADEVCVCATTSETSRRVLGLDYDPLPEMTRTLVSGQIVLTAAEVEAVSIALGSWRCDYETSDHYEPYAEVAEALCRRLVEHTGGVSL